MSTNAEQARDAGIQRVLHHTPEAYAKAFHRRFLDLMHTYRPFTSEDIVNVVGQPPNHHNAIGALMNTCVRAAKKEGLIVATGWKAANHDKGHARAIRIYRGIYQWQPRHSDHTA